MARPTDLPGCDRLGTERHRQTDCLAMTERLSTRYTRTAEGAYLAYQISGNGPMDVVLPITGNAAIELIWDEPSVSGFISRLASFSRLITFDPRGFGSSGRLLSTDLLEEAISPQSEGYCPVLGEDVTFGLGFKPTVPRRPFGPNPRSFGHFGTGGAVGFADPDVDVAFGYAMNHVIPRWQSSRNRALIDTLYRSL